MVVLGLDVGTTGVKAVVVDPHGTILGRAYREYAFTTEAHGWAELDPAVVRRAATMVIRRAVADAGTSPEAIGISSPGEAFVPVDAGCRPVGAAIVSFDVRALPIYERVINETGAARIEAVTGQRPLPHYALFKWLWWKHHRPEAYARTAQFVSLGGMVARLLGGRPAIDESLAVRTLIYDRAQHRWAAGLAEELGLDIDRFPPILEPRASCGTVSAYAARSLGITAGAEIAVGGLDQACAAFGAGIADSEGMLSVGTTAVIAVSCSDETAVSRFLPSVPHVVPAAWLALAGSPAGGSALRWLRDVWYPAPAVHLRRPRISFDMIVDAVEDRETSVLFLPHLGGSRVAFNDPDATGAFLGLTFGAARSDLTRAVLDGVAYEIAMLVDRLQDAGLAPTRLRAVGGGSRSRTWLQIIADATTIGIDSTGSSDVAAVGAARLANHDTDPAGSRGGELPPVPVSFAVEPRSAWRPYHAPRLERFRAAQAAIRGVRDLAPNARRTR
jgi:xylulokinase